ncbi:hypothetical protein ABPG72_001986 [Tetrahymena utriculariae]
MKNCYQLKRITLNSFCNIDKQSIYNIIQRLSQLKEEYQYFEYFENDFNSVTFTSFNSKIQENVILKFFCSKINNLKYSDDQQLRLIKETNSIEYKYSQKQLIIDKFLIYEFTFLKYAMYERIILPEELNNSNCSFVINLLINKHQFNIEIQGIKMIGSLLSKCSNLINLDLFLFWCKIGIEGIKVIARSLSNCVKLNCLNIDLQDNYLGSESISQLGKNLSECQNLQVLNLLLC